MSIIGPFNVLTWLEDLVTFKMVTIDLKSKGNTLHIIMFSETMERRNLMCKVP